MSNYSKYGTLSDLLKKILVNGIHLKLENNSISVTADKKVNTNDLHKKIKAHKESLTLLLTKNKFFEDETDRLVSDPCLLECYMYEFWSIFLQKYYKEYSKDKRYYIGLIILRDIMVKSKDQSLSRARYMWDRLEENQSCSI